MGGGARRACSLTLYLSCVLEAGRKRNKNVNTVVEGKSGKRGRDDLAQPSLKAPPILLCMHVFLTMNWYFHPAVV